MCDGCDRTGGTSELEDGLCERCREEAEDDNDAESDSSEAEADITAEVLRREMKPLLDAGPQAALVVALNKMAEKGVTNLHVGPELMNLLTNATGR